MSVVYPLPCPLIAPGETGPSALLPMCMHFRQTMAFCRIPIDTLSRLPRYSHSSSTSRAFQKTGSPGYSLRHRHCNQPHE